MLNKSHRTKAKRPLRIGFDANPLIAKQKTGVSYYTQGLINALATYFPEEIELVGYYSDFLGHRSQPAPDAKNIHYRSSLLLPSQLLNFLRRHGFPVPCEVLLKERTDFHLFTNFTDWPSIHKTPSAVVIYDLYYLERPDYVSRRNQQDLLKLVPIALDRSSFIITISEATKNALYSAYPKINKPLLVEHIAPDKPLIVSSEICEQTLRNFGINKPYILFVGTLEPRKNINGLLGAYSRLSKDLQNQFSLILVGGKGWNYEPILDQITKMKGEGLDIISTGYVSDEQKAALYQRATMLALLSGNEGFGMPLLEAMSYKIPILVSDIPVFHEVAKNSVLYCNQLDENDVAKCLTKLLTNTELRQELAKNGLRRLEDFSWEDVAKHIFREIKSCIGHDAGNKL
ncbi:MAG: glycosyltransferase family 1 protein [Candidatus Saccharimonadales bacterium]